MAWNPNQKLFLDSKEPDQNKNIYNYKARKYNKWLKQDYLLTDSESAEGLFETAFPNQHTQMIPYGYPRISYLLHYQNDKNHQKKIKDALNVDRTKPILLYAPTWHATKDSTELMSISPELIEEYHVIFKGHIEDDMTHFQKVQLKRQIILKRKIYY